MRYRLLTLPVIWLTACLPLLRGHLPWRGDGVLHVYRLAHLQRAVANGDFYPRWLPDLALGHGFPLFNYYAPLSYYIALPFTWISSPQTAIRIAYILAIGTTGFAIYTWSRRLWQNETAALLSSAIAVYSPYLLYNIHERGAFAEAWGIALIAASFSAVDALIRTPNRRNWLLTTFSVAALLLIHNISALIAAPLLAIYVLWNALSSPPLAFGRGGWGVRVFSAAICGLGLSAFFWLPAMLEQNLVQIGRLTQDPALDFRNHFLTWQTLFALPQSADPTQVNPPIPFGISIPAAVLALLSFPRGRESILLSLLTFALILLTIPIAQPVWEIIPLISFLQFPWRLVGVISLFLAVLAGGVVNRQWFIQSSPYGLNHRLEKKQAKASYRLSALKRTFSLAGGLNRTVIVGIIVVIVFGYGLFWLFPARLQSPLDLSVAGSIAYELETGALGTTSSADYLPTSVQTIPPPTNRQLRTTSDATINETMRYLGTSANVSHSQSWMIEYGQFYYAGWQATLDGEPIPLTPAPESGLISAEIPAGTHTLTIDWQTTPIRRSAMIISSLFVFIAIGCIYFLKPIQVVPPPLPSGRGGRGVRVFATIALTTALLKLAILNNTHNPWHNPRFDGETVTNADFTVAHNFQNALTLRGYDLPTRPVPNDRPIPLTLYWQGNPATDFNPAISVHLIDDQGRFFGQSDQYRPANFPLNRWQPNEYAEDTHALLPLELTPPGIYTLRVFVLNDETGARLDLLNSADQPVGNHVDLGTVTLERGGRNFFSLREWLGQTQHVALDMDGALPSVQVGETVPLTLYWGAVRSAPLEEPTAFVLFEQAENIIAEQPFQPLNIAFSIDDMREGERWREPQTFRVPSLDQNGTPLDSGEYTLAVRVGDVTIPLRGQLTITAPERTFEIPEMQHIVNAEIGDAATLLGYDISAESLILYWQPQREFTISYTRFVHFLDENDVILVQNDAVPGRATTGWISAEIITDTIPLSLPETATHLSIGLYDPATATRIAEPLILPLR